MEPCGGWTLEIEIPVSTLNVDPNAEAWGINFQRTVRRKNEESLWSGWLRNQGLNRLSNAGLLVGLEDIAEARGLDVKPQLLSTAAAACARSTTWTSAPTSSTTRRSVNFTMQSTLCMLHLEATMLRFILRLGLGAALLVVSACQEQPPDSALIQAARTGSLDTITLLLDSGADVHLPGPTGDDWDATPLQHAILARQSGAVRVLLERGADPNRVAGPHAPAPLLLAAGDTDPTFVNLLLAHGADPTVEDENGVTPLARAVSAGTIHGPDRPMFGGCRVDTVRALLAHDPALRLKRNAAGSNAIWWARVQGCADVLRLIGE